MAGPVHLIDHPAGERFSRLEAVVPPALLVPRLWADHPEAAQGFFDEFWKLRR